MGVDTDSPCPCGADYPSGVCPRDHSKPVTEFGFSCKLCGTSESWTTDEAHLAAARYHVWVTHPEEWEAKWPGESPGPRPGTLGRKLFHWESQL